MRRCVVLGAACVLLTVVPVAAQSLVKDLNATPLLTSSSPEQFVVAGNVAYFSAKTPDSGRELWTTDGSATGTRFVKDIHPGAKSSAPYELTVLGKHVFFAASGERSRGLWKSDGTSFGTALMKSSTGAFFEPLDLVVMRGVLYFTAKDAAGRELWRSDGTTAGTWMVKDIRSRYGSDPSGLTVVGNRVYFAANDGVRGTELWATDGTPSGTVLVADIWSGGASSAPTELSEVAGKIVFTAHTSALGREVWISDGTAAGTKLLKDVEPGAGASDPRRFTRLGSALLFTATTSKHGEELWRTDGTSSGTTLLKDIRTGTIGSRPSAMTTAGGLAFFSADDGALGRELWASDGSLRGTFLVRDIRVGSGSSNPEQLGAAGNRVYFAADDGSAGSELWVSDGWPTGTVRVKDIRAGAVGSRPSHMSAFGSRVLFAADDGKLGAELWSTDGSGAGTKLIRNLDQRTGDSSPVGLVEFQGDLFFLASSSNPGVRDLWRSDGTSQGTSVVKAVMNPNSNWGSRQMVRVGDSLLFAGYSFASGTEIWRSDGTASGTAMLKDIRAGRSQSFPDNFVVVGSRAYFTASPRSGELQLFQSDGRTVRASLTIARNSNVSRVRYGVAGDKLFVCVEDGWGSNKTWALYALGASRGGKLVPRSTGFAPPSPQSFFAAEMGGVLYFGAGSGLWRSDGTNAGTSKVKDVRFIHEITAVRDKVFFSGYDTAKGQELWVSDGTATGTRVVKDIHTSGSAAPRELTAAGRVVYFAADDGASGYELWRSDGTAGGTIRVVDAVPGADSGHPYEAPIAAAGQGEVVVAALRDLSSGVELWRSDGSVWGTRQLTEIGPGHRSSNPDGFLRLGKWIYFAATGPDAGRELWRIPHAATTGAISEPFGKGCPGGGSLVPGISTRGVPSVPSSDFVVELSRGRGLAPALLMISPVTPSTVLPGGCELHVTWTPWFLPARTFRDGSAEIKVPIPNSVSLIGVEAHAQWAVDDPAGGVFGTTSLSDGLWIVVGK